MGGPLRGPGESVEALAEAIAVLRALVGRPASPYTSPASTTRWYGAPAGPGAGAPDRLWVGSVPATTAGADRPPRRRLDSQLGVRRPGRAARAGEGRRPGRPRTPAGTPARDPPLGTTSGGDFTARAGGGFLRGPARALGAAAHRARAWSTGLSALVPHPGPHARVRPAPLRRGGGPRRTGGRGRRPGAPTGRPGRARHRVRRPAGGPAEPADRTRPGRSPASTRPPGPGTQHPDTPTTAAGAVRRGRRTRLLPRQSAQRAGGRSATSSSRSPPGTPTPPRPGR